MSKRKEKSIWEFGDFQTPDKLAVDATRLLQHLHIAPRSVIEPTCGRGSFLLAAADAFPRTRNFLGVDINKEHITHLKKEVKKNPQRRAITLKHADFFSLNWSALAKELPEPILILGNPPWVTSSELGALDSSNLPEKSNFQQRRGLDAITGKSNFDISEWMILQYLKWLEGREGFIAVLCKTVVARKVLTHAWKNDVPIASARIYLVDAMKYFGASVEACFFIIGLGDDRTQECHVYDNLADAKPVRRFGYRDGLLVSDIEQYGQWRHLRGVDSVYIWRSGIKHDCSKVLELDHNNGNIQNGYGESVSIEDTYLYPLYKSSDIGNGDERSHRKYLLITQQYIGENTNHIRQDAPKTWRYLERHERDFSKRKSSIYQDRPRFSIFGLGEYTFAPWKVAISGFYKNLRFKCIGPTQKRPAVFDDTVYLLPCWSKDEADFLVNVLSSRPAQEFLGSMVFWSDKRPITAELLRRLDIKALSSELGRVNEYLAHTTQRSIARAATSSGQMSLVIAEEPARYRKSVQIKEVNSRHHRTGKRLVRAR